MARLVDYEALLLDLRAELQTRASWGRGQVLGLIVELEQKHRVEEDRDAAVLRRFSGHLHDTLIGLVPMPTATSDPLTGSAPAGTGPVMNAGADSDQSTEGTTSCPMPSPRRSRPQTQASRLDAAAPQAVPSR